MPINIIDGRVSGSIAPINKVSGSVSSVESVSGNVSIAPGGGGRWLPPGGAIGDILTKTAVENYAADWVTPASRAEQDNTRPITSAAVYTEIGNINALLATI